MTKDAAPDPALQQARSNALKMLEYDPQWLESGLLDPEFLKRQAEEYRQGEDPNTEHYRYAAFLRWIDARDRYEDAEIRQFLFLVEADPDKHMSLAAGRVLLWKGNLTDTQFQDLADFLERLSEGRLKKSVDRERGLRELRRTRDITPAAFERYMALADSAVQDYLLQNFVGNNEAYLEALAEKGATRRVHNMAGQKLKGLKRRKRTPNDTDK